MKPRQKPLVRYSWIRRGTKRIRPRKPRTAEEQAEKFAREYGSTERVKWIRGLGCLICGPDGRGVNAHTKHPSSGTGYKGDYVAIVPLCLPHEKEKHRHGEETFNAKYARQLLGRSLASWAETIAHAWVEHCAPRGLRRAS